MKNTSEEVVYFRRMETRIGVVYAYATEHELVEIGFQRKPIYKAVDGLRNQPLKMFAQQLDQYLAGQRFAFDLPLRIDGTDFQKAAWEALMNIPYGKTLSYSEQAKAMGRVKAVRAVGSANGKNHFAIVIPCHRVISADGGLGGYSGGLKNKVSLLAHEQEVLARSSKR